MLLAALAAFPASRLARRAGFIAHPRADRYHRSPVPLLGGAAWLVGAAGAVGLAWLAAPAVAQPAGAGSLLPAVGLGIAGFFLIGLRDDRRALAPLPKAGMQLVVWAAVLAAWRPAGPLAQPAGLALAALAGTVLINAWNYLDHADGVLATVGAISGAVLGLAIGPALGGGPFFALLWAGVGGLLGFLLWNLPPARLFLGDSGSLPIGFLLAFSSLVLIERGGPEARTAAAAAHAIPVADLLLVTLVRLARGANPFRGGREHTGHRLFRALGASRALLLLALCGTGLGLFALLYGPAHPGAGPALVACFVATAALALSAVSAPGPPAAPGSSGAPRRRRAGKRSI